MLSIDEVGELHLNVGDDEESPLAEEQVVELGSASAPQPADAGPRQGRQAGALRLGGPGDGLLQQAGAASVGFLTKHPRPPTAKLTHGVRDGQG